MKIAFTYPTNRAELLTQVERNESPDNLLYGFNYINTSQKAHLCEVNETAEKILNFLFFPLDKLFLSQIDIDFKLARAILMIRQLNRADIIVSNIDGISLAIAFLKKIKIVKTPMIYAVGLFYIKGKMVDAINNNRKSSFFNLYNWILTGSDHFFFHAPIEKEKLVKLNIYNPVACTFMPLGSDSKYFSPARNYKTENNLVLSVGKDRARDYKTLLQAAKKLPKIQFAVVCRRSNLKNYIIPRNVQTFFDIPYNKILDLYKKATVVIIPMTEMQRSSGQMTLTDTMQAAKPMAITNVSGIAHYNLKGSQNCILVEPENQNQVVRAIQDLLIKSKFRNKIAQNLFKLAKNYSTENYAKNLGDVITYVSDPIKLYPLNKENLEFIRKLRNNNRTSYINDQLISKEQQDTWYKKYIKRYDDFMFVLKKSGKKIGMGAIYGINYQKQSAEIGRFAIDKKFRGQGLGKILLKKILSIGFERLDLKTLKLEVFSGNVPALKLYRSAGFIVTAKKDINGKNITFMEKTSSI